MDTEKTDTDWGSEPGPDTDWETERFQKMEENIRFMITTSEMMATLCRVQYLNYLKVGFSEDQALRLCK